MVRIRGLSFRFDENYFLSKVVDLSFFSCLQLTSIIVVSFPWIYPITLDDSYASLFLFILLPLVGSFLSLSTTLWLIFVLVVVCLYSIINLYKNKLYVLLIFFCFTTLPSPPPSPVAFFLIDFEIPPSSPNRPNH